MEHKMCHKCNNYFNDPNKKKQQHERGVWFAFEKPKKVGAHLTSILTGTVCLQKGSILL
jgi:hypothetical protein